MKKKKQELHAAIQFTNQFMEFILNGCPDLSSGNAKNAKESFARMKCLILRCQNDPARHARMA